MTSHFRLDTPCVLAVLDIETALDPAAAAIAGHRSGSLPMALQRISTACLLVASESPAGAWDDLALHTLSAPSTEFDILMQLDGLLADALGGGALLVTYNGLAHEVPVIRRRAARHWMFGLPGLGAIGSAHHLDVLLRQRDGRRDRAPTLRQACAGLGFSSADPRAETEAGLPPGVVKCQSDVVATFLLALFEIAADRGSEEALVAGWDALSRHLAASRPRALHLEHFRDHPTLRAARRARGTPSRMAATSPPPR